MKESMVYEGERLDNGAGRVEHGGVVVCLCVSEPGMSGWGMGGDLR